MFSWRLRFHWATMDSKVFHFMYISCLYEEFLLITRWYDKWNTCCWSYAGSHVKWQCEMWTVVCRVFVIAWRMMASDFLVGCIFRCDRQKIAFLPSKLPGLHEEAGNIEDQGIIFFPSIKLLRKSPCLQESTSCYRWQSCNCIL